ncbi:aminopeptidase family protein P [Frigidibacter sp. RF13]|uniref:aminopeptidase P family protein n=1 Tax=Frigidibacter sp. RF13 TaxID=2997340 RepID=UPI0022706B4C|nr:aminopeptidase P family protein [Frigidibacter sp. RF13]MCY1127160.1 aminopeptidase family protein P [Frigidibacter sp. RF13]
MFQTFEVTAEPRHGAARLGALRAALAAAGLQGFIVPRADVHQGEYVADCDARLQWLTGFTGSAGFCVVLPEVAGVFVDGRYRTQVKGQVDLTVYTPVDWPEVKAGDWITERAPAGARIGYDPWLHTAREIEEIEARLAGTGIGLVAAANLVDAVWTDRPTPPCGKVAVHPIELAGESSADKRRRLGGQLGREGQATAVLTLPDSLSWLLNIRGADIPRNPVVQCLGLLQADGNVDLFIDQAKLGPEVLAHLGPSVRIAAPEAFEAALRELRGRIRVDRATAPVAVSRILAEAGAEVVWGQDPCLLPKARKNEAEIAGMVEAHLRDGAAMVEFLAWLDAEVPKGGMTEIRAVTALEGFRRASNALRDISFETICGSGPNGAIMHYRVSEESDRPFGEGEIVVIDSGGQYLDGTTDITRTVAIGAPGQVERDCFTRVLQGMIAISRLRWPKGVAGSHLDAIARYPLWLAHQDFNHGTGHGVGAYLSVHEGPMGLSRRYDVPLEAGMILSNEPGYYREGAFGIRIENLLLVETAVVPEGGDAEREMLCMRTLTFVPIDRRLIAAGLMTRAEVDWLNDYHAEVAAKIGPRVSEAARRWLDAATAPL